jgi:hypothetical protein
MPSTVVYESSGSECLQFIPKRRKKG